jgi:carboxymethylenebutenolidase
MSDAGPRSLDDVFSEVENLNPERALTRRGFVKTSLAAGFAAAVLPVQAQTMITTDTQGLTAGAVKIPAVGGEMPAYRAMPAGGRDLATVLVVQEIFGVHEHIRDICRRLAKAGYLAVAPELFARQGDVSNMSAQEIISNIVPKVADSQVLGDLDAAAAWAAGNGGDGVRLGVTGFCWGGRIVWIYAAHNPRVTAAVAWYGVLARARYPGDKSAIEVADRIKAPVLGLYGSADAGSPPEAIEKMQAALREGGNTRSEIVVYPDAPHAFYADYRTSYRSEVAEDGWKRLLAWFKANGLG